MVKTKILAAYLFRRERNTLTGTQH